MPIGGDIVEVNWNHPTLGSGVLYAKADEDSTLDPGGFRSADDDAMIDGGGRMIDSLSRKRWSAEFTVAFDDVTSKEVDKLVALASSTAQATFTISHVSGTVYTGKGKPVGDLKKGMKNATIPVKLAGGGALSQI